MYVYGACLFLYLLKSMWQCLFCSRPLLKWVLSLGVLRYGVCPVQGTVIDVVFSFSIVRCDGVCHRVWDG